MADPTGNDTPDAPEPHPESLLRRLLPLIEIEALIFGIAVVVAVVAAVVIMVKYNDTTPPRPRCLGQTRATPVGAPGQEQPIAATSPGIAALAQQYEPTVKMSSLDGFWPVSVTAALRERGPTGSGTELVSGDRTVTSPTLADLQTSDSAKAYLAYPGKLSAKRTQVDDFLRGAGASPAAIAGWPDDVSAVASRTGQIYFYDGGTRCTFAGQAFTGDQALEYWFFYAYNYYPLSLNSAGMLTHPLQSDLADLDHHEGDWEHVTVLVHDGTPVDVWMARHDTEGKLIPWDQVQKDGSHPVVYPALGGHPSYPDCGAHPRPAVGDAADDYVVCRPGLYTFPGATTRLVDLAHVSWSCWPGHFGTTKGTTAQGNADDPTGLDLVAGPVTPLRQGENTGACPAIRPATAPR